MIDLDELHKREVALGKAVEHWRDKICHGEPLPEPEQVTATAKVFDAFLAGD